MNAYLDAQPTDSFVSQVEDGSGAFESALSSFATVAQSIAKLASRRGDVLEQQMSEASEVVAKSVCFCNAEGCVECH